MAINDTLYNIKTVSFNQENVRLAEGKNKKFQINVLKRKVREYFSQETRLIYEVMYYTEQIDIRCYVSYANRLQEDF